MGNIRRYFSFYRLPVPTQLPTHFRNREIVDDLKKRCLRVTPNDWLPLYLRNRRRRSLTLPLAHRTASIERVVGGS